MVGTGEIPGVAQVGADDAVAPVTAHVQKGVELAPAVAVEDHRVLSHVGVKKVVGLGYQRLVAYHQPGPAEYFLLLLCVDVRIDENTSVKLARIEVDNLALLVHDGPREVLPVCLPV